MIRRGALALACALALSGAAAAAHAFPDAGDPWSRGRARLDSLASSGRLAEARALAARRTRVAAAGFEPGWRLAESRAEERSLARRAALAPPARARLDAADRRLARAHAALEADSLAIALENARAAWSERVALLGARDLATARAALAVAEVEFALSHPGEADSLAVLARDGFAASVGPRHPSVADAEELLGRVVKNYTGLRDFALARARYDAALRIRCATTGPRSLEASSAYHGLGNLYRAARDYGAAFALLRAALDIRRERLAHDAEDVASTVSAMAFLSARRGRWEDTRRYALESLERAPRRAGALAGSYAVRLGLYGQSLLALGRADEAIPALVEAIALRESLWTQTTRDPGASVGAGFSLYRDLALALARRGEAERAFETLERASARSLLARRLGADAGESAWRGLAGRVRASLRPDEALVAWPRGSAPTDVPEDTLWACVVRSSGPVVWIALPRLRAPIPRIGTVRDALVRELFCAGQWPSRLTDDRTARALAHAMWRERFAPLLPALAGVRRLVVCGTDFFASAPLGVLEDDAGERLADRYAIAYAPSAPLFVLERASRPPASAPPRAPLLVGDPAYPASAASHWPRLAGSAEEIRAIAAAFPGATVLTGAEARASALRDLAAAGALARHGVLHFSAHTDVDEARVLKSALVLAPERATPGEVSRLEAREIAERWAIASPLVCLAGCQSVRSVSSQSEGYLGLQLAFLAAGARSLLVSMWPVDDRATALLMRGFYARLADRAHPLDRAAALSAAQREVREWRAPDGVRPYAHPAYWSGFALVGDPD